MTIHYEVQLDFRDIPSDTILETSDMEKAIKQMCRIKDFLGLPIVDLDLKVIDESTSKYDNRSRYRAKGDFDTIWYSRKILYNIKSFPKIFKYW